MGKTTRAHILLALLILCTLPFVLHATQLGLRGLTNQASESRIFTANAPLTNLSIFSHMLFGAVITVLAPLQLSEYIRQHHNRVHRLTGKLLAGFAIPAAIGGFGYIVLKGTVGGVMMDWAFALYGFLFALTAVQSARFAITKQFKRHNRWALRFFFLAIGSWLYRVHYAIWFEVMGEVGHTPTFDGGFDQVQNFAFFVPYLLILELVITRRDGPFWARNR